MQIYYADPAAFDDTVLRQVTPLLPPEKQRPIATIRHLPSRRQATLAWALLVWALRLQNPDTALPPLSFTETGKPFFSAGTPQFNLSHTDTLVCAALSDRPVGVDAQTLLVPSVGVAKRVLSSAELSLLNAAENRAAVFTALWTQKEAFVKQTGAGIAHGLQSLDFAPYFGLDRFEAYGCSFSVFRLCGAVLAACGESQAQKPQQVTQEMLKNVLLGPKHG